LPAEVYQLCGGVPLLQIGHAICFSPVIWKESERRKLKCTERLRDETS
jgi:hypothetical protein